MVSRVAFVLGSLILVLGAIGTSSCAGGTKTTPTPTQPPVVQAPTSTPTTGPTSTPAPTPTFQPRKVIVANTGGDGVALRAGPGSTERLSAWPERTVFTVIDYDQTVDGKVWRKVKDPDGNVGWVLTDYVALPTPTPAPTSTPDRSHYKLELLASRGTIEYGYATVEGQVKNISGRSLEGVVAVVEWYTDGEQFVKSDDALIDYDPILAGQTSPFSVISTYNPAMTKYTVTFKEFFGGTIPTINSRGR